MIPIQFQTVNGLTVLLRPARVEDQSKIIENIGLVLAEKVFLQTDQFVLTPGWIKAFAASCDPHQGSLLLVPEIDGQLVGHLRVHPGEYGAKDRHVASLGIVLINGYRVMGIGKAMLKAAVEWCDRAGYEKMEVSVLSTNQHAIHLFEQFGFQIVGVLKRQLKIGPDYVDELIMDRMVTATG